MKVQGENIEVTGGEIDDIVRYPISLKFDDFLSEALCMDIEQDQAHIGKFLEWSLKDWHEAPKDYQPEDNVPRELRCFNAFIDYGEPLSAREASLILRYTSEEFAEERTGLVLRVPRDFAKDIAVASILHVAIHTEKEYEIPIIDQGYYKEVQAMPDVEAARQAWIKTLRDPVHKYEKNAYWNELKRRESQQYAAESLANANMLADAYKFSLSSAVKRSLRANRSK